MSRIKELQKRVAVLERANPASRCDRLGGISGPFAKVVNLFDYVSDDNLIAMEARLVAGGPTSEDSQFVDRVQSAIKENHFWGLEARAVIEVVAEMERSC